MRLTVTQRLERCLLFKTRTLFCRVCKLRESVRQLAPGCENFEALDQPPLYAIRVSWFLPGSSITVALLCTTTTTTATITDSGGTGCLTKTSG
jgi:hypothetical protein